MTQQPGTIATCSWYTVKPGDSLSLIAKKAYGDGAKWQWIYDWPGNQKVIGNNPDLIKPGQDLFIPHPDPITQHTNYTVQTGDTLQSISERAYCDAKYWSWIWFTNQKVIGPNSPNVHSGQVLFIAERPGLGSGHTTAQIVATCAWYTVQPGDSLWLIAERAYHDGSKWQWIYDWPGNQQVIGDNPDLIKPGQVLFVPSSSLFEDSGGGSGHTT
jgi:nucleoid-associated protein YgaU